MNKEPLRSVLRLPDPWQHQALKALKEGKDVIVQAPTGAGKTYIFECFIDANFEGDAIYTVPTRALANDKFREWKERGWDVGITTGDLSENPEAKIVVATLEAQKQQILSARNAPDLLVIDEYQFLADPQRGLNYELCIALAPSKTQLLLLSGSVGNPHHLEAWFKRLNRKVCLIYHRERPVPLEEIHAEALRGSVPNSVKGYWPAVFYRALKANLGPILAFAPRRIAAETLAFELLKYLPPAPPLELSREQRQLAGSRLSRLLQSRIAYHHSGLDYRQRAGLVEPLAKAGQLRVVVATMGLSSGINFSLRSVIVTDREYRDHEQIKQVRPDELLQMFGRAGRRGLDNCGYVIVALGKSRLKEARPLTIKRPDALDWPTLIQIAALSKPSRAAITAKLNELSQRLFSEHPPSLNLDSFNPRNTLQKENTVTQEQIFQEFLNSSGHWEKQRPRKKTKLGNTLFFKKGTWMPALSQPKVAAHFGKGSVVCLKPRKGSSPPLYGTQMILARLGKNDKEGELIINRGLIKAFKQCEPMKKIRRHHWTLDQLEKFIIPRLSQLSGGGRFVKLIEHKGQILAQLDYSDLQVIAYQDQAGKALLNPSLRTQRQDITNIMNKVFRSSGTHPNGSIADAWYALGLIDQELIPSRRGIIFSFFNQGEGLAIAAALEETAYSIEELIYDLANLRAGHRFSAYEAHSSRLGSICRKTYGMCTYPGYLKKGLPCNYGDGASEVLQYLRDNPSHRNKLINESLKVGDIQRTYLEWRSLISHIANSPFHPWERWQALQEKAQHFLATDLQSSSRYQFPKLSSAQQKRFYGNDK